LTGHEIAFPLPDRDDQGSLLGTDLRHY
jgi:hypothetical protein